VIIHLCAIDIDWENYSDQDRRTIANWLSSLNFKISQSEVFNTREGGTGE
jgi:hypothetical protein